MVSGRVGELIRRDAAASAAGADELVEAEAAMPGVMVTDDYVGREIAALIDRLPVDANAEERDAIDEQIMGLAAVTGDEFRSRLVGAKAELQQIERAAAVRSETSRSCRAAAEESRRPRGRRDSRESGTVAAGAIGRDSPD